MSVVRFFGLAGCAVLMLGAAPVPAEVAFAPLVGGGRAQIIEDFDDGDVVLLSYPEQDEDPSSWSLDDGNTYNNSPFSLKLYGNTWKIEPIAAETLSVGDVWQVAAYTDIVPEIHGFGLMDSGNVLLYSFAGTEELDPETWVTVYQGAFDDDQWNIYQLPVAADWVARFGYVPVVDSLVFVNDNDAGLPGVVYFDEIVNITEDLPVPPTVAVTYTVGPLYVGARGDRSVDVQFYGDVTDPDSYEHDYFWDFGDDSTSTLEDPLHTFVVLDDHAYTVMLQVIDDTDQWGWASCAVQVDSGPTSFPVTINFTGDVMLARGMETIIQNQGVEAIFQPTLAVLGNDADLSIVNLECPLTNHTQHHPTKPIYFKGDPENVAGLVYAGIDVVTLANNHTMDYLLPGLQETQTVLDTSGILFSGAGANSYEAYLPLFCSTSGVTVAFLANSNRTGQYNNYQPYLDAGYNKPGFANLTYYDVAQQIAAVQGCADLVVVESHSGNEYSIVPLLGSDGMAPPDPDGDEGYSPLLIAPGDDDRELRQHTVDCGADLVICHHPHIMQGVEVYGGKLIVHSLGNFAFDMGYAETFPSMILKAEIDASGFSAYSITPVFIDDYIPRPAQGELGLHILDYLAERSKDLDTYLYVGRQDVRATVILDTLSMDVNTLAYARAVPVHEHSGLWVSDPLRLERWGNLSSVDSVSPGSGWEYRLGRDLVWFGNFEDEGSTGWDPDTEYESYDSTVSYRGSRSLVHQLPPLPYNIVTRLENRIKRYDDASFSVHGWIRTQDGEDVTLRVSFHETRTGAAALGYDGIGVEISGDSDWTYYHNEVSVPGATEYFDVYPKSCPPLLGEAVSWFDDVGLIGWTTWQPFSGPTSVTNPNEFYYVQVRIPTQTDTVHLHVVETAYGEIVYPQIVIDPPSISRTLPAGAVDTCSVSLANTGTAELSFTLNADPTWLSVGPEAGSVEPGGEVPVSVVIDATELSEGSYSGSLVVQSNDPYEPTVVVPVDLTVTPEGMVTDLTIAVQGDSVLLSWSPVPNVLYYNVYRSDSQSGPWQLLASQDSTSYVDEAVLQLHDEAFYQIRSELPSGIPSRRKPVSPPER
jgi:poly-gamma-glutamate capsule biosynthesis protein CapA/YwtB (metallophosphatase superfamily)